MTRRRVPAGKLLVLPPTRRGTAPSVAAQQQQQQLQVLPPPPPPPPPAPTLRHQPPQYQAAAIVGGGAAEGGAGVSRPPSVARFSRNYAPGGRGGASAGGGAGRETGSNWQYGLCHLAEPTEGGAGAKEEWTIFVDARRSVGILLPPNPRVGVAGPVSR